MSTPVQPTPERQQLTRRYHTLCRQLGMTAEERLNLLSAYGVQTSLDLSLTDLQKLVIHDSTPPKPITL